jgi:hypothetical protein
MREVITDDVGQVRVGGVLLPGFMESLEVAGALRIDEAEVEGQSGTSKTPMGFEDATVTLRVRLVTDDDGTSYDKCREIVSLFQGTDSYAQPFVCRLVNRHTALWGIDEVLFRDLKTSESNKDDTMYADITFVEYIPVAVLAEEVAPDGEVLTSGKPPKLSDHKAAEDGWQAIDKVAALKAQQLYAAADTDALNRE